MAQCQKRKMKKCGKQYEDEGDAILSQMLAIP